MRKTLLLLAITTLLVMPGAIHADDSDPALGAALRQTIVAGLAAYDREDVDGVLGYVDTRSPEFPAARKELEAQFAQLDVKTELSGFQLIGHDDEFAYARVKVKTTGPPDAAFVDNVIDTVVLFHRQDGRWKYWSELILGVVTLP